MKVLSSRIAAIVFAAACLAPLGAQAPQQTIPPDAASIKSLTWRAIGPSNQAGRISVIVGVAGDPSTYYVSGANGGIFKTTNGGTTFTPIFDDQSVLSIGAIAIAPSDPNVLYVGTGEGNPRNNASFGDGVSKPIALIDRLVVSQRAASGLRPGK